jgi:hypothetical protein
MFEGPCIVKFMSVIVQEDETIYSLFIFVNCSTYFKWQLHLTSRARITVSTVSGIIETVQLPVTFKTGSSTVSIMPDTADTVI